MENFKDSDIIIRFLAQETTDSENSKVLDWKKQNKANEDFFEGVKKIWDNPDIQKYNKKESINEIWDKFNVNLKKTESKTQNHTSHANNEEFVSWKFYFFRIAAVFVLGIGIWHFLKDDIATNNRITVIENSSEITKEVVLPDSSVVFLNSKSKIEYQNDFSKMRKVHLNGEAFFDIKKGVKTFQVQLSNAIIEVHGTSFSINSFEEKDEIEVIVATGNVLFLDKKDDLNTQKVYLQFGEKASLKKSINVIEKSINEHKNFLSWKTKKFVFEKASINKIVDDLEKAYKKEIIVNQDINDKFLLSARFSEQSLDNIINILNREFSKINENYSNIFSFR